MNFKPMNFFEQFGIQGSLEYQSPLMESALETPTPEDRGWLHRLGFGKPKKSSYREIPITEGLRESIQVGISGVTGISGQHGDYGIPEGNFIGDSFYDTGGVFGRYINQAGTLEIERGYIMHQRSISLMPEVAIGIEEIMRDLFDRNDPLTLEVDLPEGIDFDPAVLHRAFKEYLKQPFRVLGDSKTPPGLLLFNLLRQGYIDGNLCILAAEIDEGELTFQDNRQYLYGQPPKAKSPSINALNESLVHGYKYAPGNIQDWNNLTQKDLDWIIQQQDVSLLEKKTKSSKSSGDPKTSKTSEANKKKLVFIPLDPSRIVLDATGSGNIRYDLRRASYGHNHSIEISPDRLFQADFGLFDMMGARYGFLQYAVKYANQLQTLQDMLVPMRFRRSIARRIFNVDVAGLPPARAMEYMKDIQRKFKYRKSYDVKQGRITNEDKEPIGIVEDYWFANRSGSKGTTVEMMDEAGNFADSLEDIAYFNKKLYQSMFIPLRRIFESDAEYDYTSSSIEVDELRFHSFLQRIRAVYDNIFTEVFRFYLKHEFEAPDTILQSVKVYLRFDNSFHEDKKLERFEKALNLWDDAISKVGTAYSAETMMNRLFGFTVEDFQYETQKIEKEKEEGNLYAGIHKAAEDGDDY